MKQDFREFTSRNATIVVVAPHSTEKVAARWKEAALPMIVVPDPEGTLSDRYGQEWKLLKFGLMPALFVVDRKGSLAFVQYGTSMSDIPENGVMLKVLDGLKGS
jgi:peroxiredoxin Q/BCP